MPKAQQRRHSARVLTSAWARRAALSEAAPGANGERAGWLVLLVLTTHTELTDRMLIFSERQLRHLLDTVLVFRPPSGP